MNRQKTKKERETRSFILFYDGSCGLCHGFVRFALKRLDPIPFFAPIGGITFLKMIQKSDLLELPDSFLLFTIETQKVLFKTEAVRELFSRMKAPWSFLAFFFRLVPLSVANFFYDKTASRRHLFFKKPGQACPKLSEKIAAYFLE